MSGGWRSFGIEGSRLLIPKPDWWHFQMRNYGLEYEVRHYQTLLRRTVVVLFRGENADLMHRKLDHIFKEEP